MQLISLAFSKGIQAFYSDGDTVFGNEKVILVLKIINSVLENYVRFGAAFLFKLKVLLIRKFFKLSELIRNNETLSKIKTFRFIEVNSCYNSVINIAQN